MAALERNIKKVAAYKVGYTNSNFGNNSMRGMDAYVLRLRLHKLRKM